MVTPVSFSPFKIARCMGAAPRYLGNSEACIFMAPFRGTKISSSGKMRNATTTNISADPTVAYGSVSIGMRF